MFSRLFFILIFILLSSCAAPRYEALPERGFSTYAVASWYGPGFHGRPTASGEIFNMHDKTAAHKTLPFGTRLRVINEKTGLSTVVVINDRGPFVEGRDIDLSFASAKEIGISGTGPVRLQYLGRDESYIKTVKYSASLGGPFTIQVGSFEDFSNAGRLKDALELKYKNVYIMNANINGKIYYRVRLGKFLTRDNAYIQAKTLADEGYGTLITRYEEQI